MQDRLPGQRPDRIADSLERLQHVENELSDYEDLRDLREAKQAEQNAETRSLADVRNEMGI